MDTKKVALWSVFFEGESLGELVEVGSLVEEDGDLGVNFLSAFSLDVLFLDVLDGGITVLGEDLGSLEGEGDALTHGFDLDVAVLLDHQLGEEKPLVESRVAPNSVDVVFVELVGLGRHQHLKEP